MLGTAMRVSLCSSIAYEGIHLLIFDHLSHGHIHEIIGLVEGALVFTMANAMTSSHDLSRVYITYF